MTGRVLGPTGLLFFGCLAIATYWSCCSPGWVEGGWPQRGVMVGVLSFASFSIGVVCFWLYRSTGRP